MRVGELRDYLANMDPEMPVYWYDQGDDGHQWIDGVSVVEFTKGKLGQVYLKADRRKGEKFKGVVLK